MCVPNRKDLYNCLLDVYTKFQIDISKHKQKNPENFSLPGSSNNTPFSAFVCQRAKNCPSTMKISCGQDYISVCAKSEPSK